MSGFPNEQNNTAGAIPAYLVVNGEPVSNANPLPATGGGGGGGKTEIWDGTNTASVKPASTPVTATDSALVVGVRDSGLSPVTSVSGNFVNNASFSTPCDGYSTVQFTTTGTWDGSIAIEIYDGANWISTTYVATTSGGSSTVFSANTSGLINVVGYKEVRLRGSSVTGTVNVSFNKATQIASIMLDNSLPSGNRVVGQFQQAPLPASNKVAITGSFSATGNSAAFTPNAGRGFTFYVQGTFAGTVGLYESVDGGTNYYPVTSAGSEIFNLTAPALEQWSSDQIGVLFRLQCTNFISGTINYGISQ